MEWKWESWRSGGIGGINHVRALGRGGGPDAMRMCHVDVNRGGLAENGRRGYTGPVRKFNYGDSIPLERAVKTVGRRECTPCGYRPWGFRAARFDSREGFRGTGRMQIFRFPNGRITVHRQFFRAAISRIEMEMRRVVGEKFVES